MGFVKIAKSIQNLFCTDNDINVCLCLNKLLKFLEIMYKQITSIPYLLPSRLHDLILHSNIISCAYSIEGICFHSAKYYLIILYYYSFNNNFSSLASESAKNLFFVMPCKYNSLQTDSLVL